MAITRSKTAYLVGGMERAPMLGAAWRNRLKPVLKDLGFNVIDPVEKEINVQPENDKERNWYAYKKSKKNFHIFVNQMRKIVDLDLNIVENEASHNIILWDKYAAEGAGSQGEITLGYKLWAKRGYPIQYLIVQGMTIQEVPGWILGCTQRIFTSLDQFIRFIKKEYGTKRSRKKKKSSIKAKRSINKAVIKKSDKLRLVANQ